MKKPLILFVLCLISCVPMAGQVYQPKPQVFDLSNLPSKDTVLGAWAGSPRMIQVNTQTSGLPKSYFPKIEFVFSSTEEPTKISVKSTHFYENGTGGINKVTNRLSYLGGSYKNAHWEYSGDEKPPERRDYRVEGAFSNGSFVGKLFETQVNQIHSYSSSGELMGSRIETNNLIYEISLQKSQ